MSVRIGSTRIFIYHC